MADYEDFILASTGVFATAGCSLGGVGEAVFTVGATKSNEQELRLLSIKSHDPTLWLQVTAQSSEVMPDLRVGKHPWAANLFL
jgi:hypothetical protein